MSTDTLLNNTPLRAT